MACAAVGPLSPLLRILRWSHVGVAGTLTARPLWPHLSCALAPSTAAALTAAARMSAAAEFKYPNERRSDCCSVPVQAVGRRSFTRSTGNCTRSDGDLPEGRSQTDERRPAAMADVRCVQATEEMAEDVARLMELFVASEPLLAAASVSAADDDVRLRLRSWVRSLLRLGLSAVAVHDGGGGGGGGDCGAGRSAIVGARLNFVLHKDKPLDETMLLSNCLRHPGTAAIEHLIERVESKVDLFGLYSTDAIAVGGFNSVSREVRGRGVASALVVATDELATRRGFPVIVSTATSAYSQAMLRRLRYDELAAVEYATSLNADLFDMSKLGPHRRLVLFAKKLRR